MLDHSTEIFIKAKSYQIFLFSSEIKMISNIRTFFYINKQTKRYDGPAIALVFRNYLQFLKMSTYFWFMECVKKNIYVR